MTFTVSIADTARPALKILEKKAKNPGAGLLVAARAVGKLLKAHYRSRDQEGNKLGGDRTHFWRGVGQSVNAPEQKSPEHVTLSISHPNILQKVHGGVIRAKRAKYLTIPMHPKAHGRRASVLERALGIKLFRVKNVLMAAGADGKLTAYYALRKSVQQKPDPKALPPEADIKRTAEERFEAWMKR